MREAVLWREQNIYQCEEPDIHCISMSIAVLLVTIGQTRNKAAFLAS